MLGLAGVAAFGITPETSLDAQSIRSISRALPVPAIAAIADAQSDRYWHDERMQRGDTIGSLLARASVVDPDAMEFLRTDPSARAALSIEPGRSLQVSTDDDGRLAALRLLAGNGEILSIERDASGFVARRDAPPDDTRLTLRAGRIESSLFAAADDAGLPDSVTLALADIFGGDIDFYHDLRGGDRFVVLYETRYVYGEPVGTGRVLAAAFENRGVVLHAYLWRATDGSEGYYDEDGHSSRKAFLRSPMEFSRITSGFTLGRFRPDPAHMDRAQRHRFRGTDGHSGARDGQWLRRSLPGEQNGYGNVVMIKHDGRYSTVYAHLVALCRRREERRAAFVRATRSVTSARPDGPPGRIFTTNCASTASRRIR